MFDIGFFEILVIGLVALLVVGPERLPGLARDVGRWVGKTRRFVNSVRSDVEKEFATDELKQMMREQNREIDRLKSLMEDTEADLKRDVDEIDRSIQREVADQKDLIRNLEHDAMIPGVRRQPLKMSSDGSLTEAVEPDPVAVDALPADPGDADHQAPTKDEGPRTPAPGQPETAQTDNPQPVTDAAVASDNDPEADDRPTDAGRQASSSDGADAPAPQRRS